MAKESKASTPKQDALVPVRVVEAVGTTSPLGRGVRGRTIEAAMSDAVNQVSKECEAIQARDGLSDEEKAKQIAELSSQDNIRKRKLEAREKVKADYRASE